MTPDKLTICVSAKFMQPTTKWLWFYGQKPPFKASQKTSLKGLLLKLCTKYTKGKICQSGFSELF